ncbi:MAG: Na/Pi cotransporter family protein, partial [Clostridia bacterium]|nr:Na/Pi cotransporter family protein [Clostridia bacterium]
LNDLERIGDHAKNFHEIGTEMADKKIMFSEKARAEIASMYDGVMRMLVLSKDAFKNDNKENLSELAELENGIDGMNKELIAAHFSRLVEGNCSVDVSPYFSSVISGLERVADHIVNVGFSITDPTGAENA